MVLLLILVLGLSADEMCDNAMADSMGSIAKARFYKEIDSEKAYSAIARMIVDINAVEAMCDLKSMKIWKQKKCTSKNKRTYPT